MMSRLQRSFHIPSRSRHRWIVIRTRDLISASVKNPGLIYFSESNRTRRCQSYLTGTQRSRACVPQTFFFRFYGVEIKPTDTAETHSLVHNDRIDVRCRNNDGTLTIRVLSTFADGLDFKMNTGTPMSKLFEKFKALRMGDENHANARFVFNGKDIGKEDTPESVELVDNDSIYCVTADTSGGVLSSSAGKKLVKKLVEKTVFVGGYIKTITEEVWVEEDIP
mmetsp:Transcript_18328/g.44254  ORF Transcript_18328/g.44254 Transcript_18328/m.44254 type:complete len:222 (-) Transcript_18328:298-963(-)